MPIYEYRCKDCGEINSYLEKTKKSLWDNWFNKKRCKKCSSRKLERIISPFFTHRTQTTGEMINDLKKMGPVNFVPDYRMPGPPPGGCPYAQDEKGEEGESHQ